MCFMFYGSPLAYVDFAEAELSELNSMNWKIDWSKHTPVSLDSSQVDEQQECQILRVQSE